VINKIYQTTKVNRMIPAGPKIVPPKEALALVERFPEMAA
jgi:hypothetical protein